MTAGFEPRSSWQWRGRRRCPIAKYLISRTKRLPPHGRQTKKFGIAFVQLCAPSKRLALVRSALGAAWLDCRKAE